MLTLKAQRLSWFGHIYRMPDTRTAKKVLKWNPLTNRPKGRPKNGWEDNIIQDLCQMKIEQNGRMSLGRPRPPTKGSSAPDEEEEEEEEEQGYVDSILL